MNKRLKRVQASILVVLLALMCVNVKDVSQSTKEDIKMEQTEVVKLDNKLTAGVVNEMIPEVPYETYIVAPEKNLVQTANESILNEGTEIAEPVEEETNEIEEEEEYYSMTQEEFEASCKIAIAEAGNQGLMGMVYVINCAINNANALDISLIEEYNENRYSSIVNGQICIVYRNAIGEKVQIPITEDMVTDEVRQAVNMATSKDYTEEILKDIAVAKGYDSSYYEGGAQYFYNPKFVSKKQRAKRANISVSFTHGNHVFYKSWN